MSKADPISRRQDINNSLLSEGPFHEAHAQASSPADRSREMILPTIPRSQAPPGRFPHVPLLFDFPLQVCSRSYHQLQSSKMIIKCNVKKQRVSEGSSLCLSFPPRKRRLQPLPEWHAMRHAWQRLNPSLTLAPRCLSSFSRP